MALSPEESELLSPREWALAIAVALATGCGLTNDAKAELKEQCEESTAFKIELINELRDAGLGDHLGL